MKKGFTLVELLAVIAILAIILVIAVPRINNVSKKRTEDLFFTSAQSIVREIEYKNIDNKECELMTLSDANITDIATNDYDLTNSEVLIDGDVSLHLIGLGKFEGLEVCISPGVKNKSDATCTNFNLSCN